jgi:hypothetical protein
MPELVGMNRLPVNENVAMIGHSYGCCHELEFLSDANLYEYSTLILDPREISSELLKTGGPPFRGYAYAWFTERSKQVSTWVRCPIGSTLSGLQLCGLVLMARQDPTIKEKIVDTMYSTSGVLKMALNWREFLKETEQE